MFCSLVRRNGIRFFFFFLISKTVCLSSKKYQFFLQVDDFFFLQYFFCFFKNKINHRQMIRNSYLCCTFAVIPEDFLKDNPHSCPNYTVTGNLPTFLTVIDWQRITTAMALCACLYVWEDLWYAGGWAPHYGPSSSQQTKILWRGGSRNHRWDMRIRELFLRQVSTHRTDKSWCESARTPQP